MKPKTLGVILLLVAFVAGLWAAQRYWLSDLRKAGPEGSGTGPAAGGAGSSGGG